MASLRHLCRSLQIFAKICKDAENVRFCLKERLQRWHRPHWRYKYYIPPVWTGPSLQHSWTFSIRSVIFVPSLRRLCCSLCRSLLQRPRRTPPKKFENTPHFFMISRHVFKTFFHLMLKKCCNPQNSVKTCRNALFSRKETRCRVCCCNLWLHLFIR